MLSGNLSADERAMVESLLTEEQAKFAALRRGSAPEPAGPGE
jgi:anti-sigma factor RsiW